MDTNLSFKDERWNTIKDKLRSFYSMHRDNTKAFKEIRKYALKEKSRIVEEDKENVESFELKMFTVLDFIVDQCAYKTMDKEKAEQPFTSYWTHVLKTLFRDSSIMMKTGEPTSYATKVQREINEFEYANLDKNVMGRRIDMLLVGEVLNEAKDSDIELSAIEIKPACISDVVEQTQFNKNVRTAKCLLYQHLVHTGSLHNENDGPAAHILSLDIVGLNAFFYNVYQVEDVIVAVRETGEDLFLPADEDDMKEFVIGTLMDQLLSYVDYITTSFQNIKQAIKKYKRKRSTLKKTAAYNSSDDDAELPLVDFPLHTFYTPKR